jgi:murein DD-endopeptidase MepM/ murein hydrolase activator NlpD
MCRVARPHPSSWPRLALVAAITLGAAACSSDTERFRGPPSGSRPYADLTSSAPSAPATQAAPTPSINSSALPPPPAERIAASTPPAPAKPPLTTPSVPAAANLSKHQVASGETLNKIARKYRVSVADLATVNKLAPNAKLKLGEQLAIPVRMTPPAKVEPPTKMASSLKPTAPPPGGSAHKITPTPDMTAENSAKSAATLSFRWPARGRVISGFGPKPSGLENAGINLALPEGTPVKAAEDGVVVYASNALTTYGNLVLIKHASGFVTTYAHLSEINVKRDEPVKRGQVIGKSGQTGNVATPQLHFEIRKESTPVDPLPYLDRSNST